MTISHNKTFNNTDVLPLHHNYNSSSKSNFSQEKTVKSNNFNSGIILNEINKTSQNIDKLYDNPLIKEHIMRINLVEENKPKVIKEKEFMNLVSKQNFKEVGNTLDLKTLHNGPIVIDSLFLQN